MAIILAIIRFSIWERIIRIMTYYIILTPIWWLYLILFRIRTIAVNL